MKNQIKHYLLRIFIWMVIGTTIPVAAQKIKISRADELPRRTIDLTGNVKDIHKNDELIQKNCANLAAKILAINPTLSPTEIINTIRSTATPDPEGKGLLLIHPKNALRKIRK